MSNQKPKCKDIFTKNTILNGNVCRDLSIIICNSCGTQKFPVKYGCINCNDWCMICTFFMGLPFTLCGFFIEKPLCCLRARCAKLSKSNIDGPQHQKMNP